jgi:hypothetical protein
MSSNNHNNDLEGDDIWGDGTSNDNPNGDDDENKEDGSDNKSPAETSDVGTSTTASAAAAPPPAAAAAAAAAAPAADGLEDDETRHMTVGELRQRIHLINNDIRVMKSDVQRITHESRAQRDRIKENQEKVKLNKQLPYLVANVVEILEPDAEDGKQMRRRKKDKKRLFFRGIFVFCMPAWRAVVLHSLIIHTHS